MNPPGHVSVKGRKCPPPPKKNVGSAMFTTSLTCLNVSGYRIFWYTERCKFVLFVFFNSYLASNDFHLSMFKKW